MLKISKVVRRTRLSVDSNSDYKILRGRESDFKEFNPSLSFKKTKSLVVKYFKKKTIKKIEF
jgi:hypothetical protein